MSSDPDCLPALVSLEDYHGVWHRYVDEVFAIFHKDFIESQPKYAGRWVRCSRKPIYDGKEAGFWHCTSEGPDETKRTPDLRRCARIAWVRAVISNSHDPAVDTWPNRRGREKCRLFWFREEFLVVLAERERKRDGFRYWLLKSAYCPPEEHRKEKLRKERDAAMKRLTPLPPGGGVGTPSTHGG